MKDLYNHQKSMNYGVNRLKRRLCRVSSKVKNTNHNLMYIVVKVEELYNTQSVKWSLHATQCSECGAVSAPH